MASAVHFPSRSTLRQASSQVTSELIAPEEAVRLRERLLDDAASLGSHVSLYPPLQPMVSLQSRSLYGVFTGGPAALHVDQELVTETHELLRDFRGRGRDGLDFSVLLAAFPAWAQASEELLRQAEVGGAELSSNTFRRMAVCRKLFDEVTPLAVSVQEHFAHLMRSAERVASQEGVRAFFTPLARYRDYVFRKPTPAEGTLTRAKVYQDVAGILLSSRSWREHMALLPEAAVLAIREEQALIEAKLTVALMMEEQA